VRGERSLDAVSRASYFALSALCVALPFETRAPLLGLGTLGVTSSELFLYAALVLWAASRLLGSVGSWTPAHAAVLAWAFVALVSAAAATHEPGAAFKFALRSLSGVLLFFAVADQARTRRRVRGIAAALLSGALVAALLTVAEPFLPGLARGLLAFKAATFRLEGALRPSGSLGYPTIASMYFEAVLPVLVAAVAGSGGRRFRSALVAALGVIVAGIVFTGSRAGLVTAFVTLVALGAADSRGGLGLRRITSLAAAILVLVSAAAWAMQPAVADRLRMRGDGAWYRADFHPAVSSLSLAAGGETEVSVRLRNRGTVEWAAAGPAGVLLSYEWLDSAGRSVFEGPQLPIRQDVGLEEEATVNVPLRAPRQPGAYRLRWQLGPEGRTWGGTDTEERGDVMAHVTAGETMAASEDEAVPRRPVQRPLNRRELWRAGLALWRERPLLGVGPDNFRRLYARVLGPHPLNDRIRANSLYVEVLADTGALGLASLLAFIAAMVRVAARESRTDPDPESRRWRLAATAGLAAFLVHGLVDEFLAFTPTLGLFWLLAGCAVAREADR
jgi:O-antigen ligase